ncbi:unnamed protein product [Albugo candida]|uniref:Uncharacterized protein n=1 Tax=Albugo candida TaxID=65357 RepID=A0A024GKM3_9STRA|nr:unnamed protein product [Albugo candida]|eukprot:CCI47084.1 unnamed protein product [Albugo candida]
MAPYFFVISKWLFIIGLNLLQKLQLPNSSFAIASHSNISLDCVSVTISTTLRVVYACSGKFCFKTAYIQSPSELKWLYFICYFICFPAYICHGYGFASTLIIGFQFIQFFEALISTFKPSYSCMPKKTQREMNGDGLAYISTEAGYVSMTSEESARIRYNVYLQKPDHNRLLNCQLRV